ncbi:DOMON domain-containing protein FRRS1L [Elysia marginata]|uniref:DOMON domain-containing protein FRRS1L n=1 Tax=Elysia marginata TaxID=1093978 RepID=A0AAV4HVZ2_9GAST|nr:DOMON domain-containing protein FRRS1L [Elysia marginata]
MTRIPCGRLRTGSEPVIQLDFSKSSFQRRSGVFSAEYPSWETGCIFGDAHFSSHHEALAIVELRACPPVRNLVLQLRSLGFIQRRPHKGRVISCSRFHDTIVLNKPGDLQVISIAPVSSRKSGDMYSIAWNYEVETNDGSSRWFYTDKKGPEEDEPDPTTTEPSGVREDSCRSSSVRFGTPQCKHTECEYLLTYTFVNHTMLVIELSGKSDGWVALRLSSDQQMGGDELIACKRRSHAASGLEAVSGWVNLPHSKPQRKSVENLQLVEHKYENGYIYCKMVRTTSLDEVGGDTSLDLTAKWYQIYAKGKIDRGGAMLQSSENPPTTSEPISMLVPFQISIPSYQSQSVKVSEQTRQSKCEEGDPLGSTRLAAPKLDSPFFTMTMLLLLVWKLGV